MVNDNVSSNVKEGNRLSPLTSFYTVMMTMILYRLVVQNKTGDMSPGDTPYERYRQKSCLRDIGTYFSFPILLEKETGKGKAKKRQQSSHSDRCRYDSCRTGSRQFMAGSIGASQGSLDMVIRPHFTSQ